MTSQLSGVFHFHFFNYQTFTYKICFKTNAVIKYIAICQLEQHLLRPAQKFTELIQFLFPKIQSKKKFLCFIQIPTEISIIQYR